MFYWEKIKGHQPKFRNKRLLAMLPMMGYAQVKHKHFALIYPKILKNITYQLLLEQLTNTGRLVQTSNRIPVNMTVIP